MTPQQLGPDVSRHPTPPDYTPRLRLKPKAPPTGHVDGAWWPWSENLTKELPDLLAVLSVRLGPIHRVRYHSGEWAKAPAELAVDGRTVRLDGDRGSRSTRSTSSATKTGLFCCWFPRTRRPTSPTPP
jgi:hypothetical protein